MIATLSGRRAGRALRNASRLLIVGLLALVLALVWASPSSAAVANPAPAPVEASSGALSIAFAPSWLQVITLLVTVILPLLVGLVTTRETNSSRKAVYLAILAAVTGFGSELLEAISSGTTYDAAGGLFTAVTALVVAIALHFGIYKPTGAASALQATGRHRSVE